jgi:hypothetical protein
VFEIDVKTKKLSQICAGSSLTVVPKGPDAGRLVVQQHRYYSRSGSYDWFFLLEPTRKEIVPLGADSDPEFASRLAEVLGEPHE